MVKFDKNAKNHHEHIALWQHRGLIISDIARAERYLSFISYYRLSAYTIPFQNKDHVFKPNTSFDDILTLYVFDRQLRLLVMDALERIEVAVRTQISNVIAVNQNDAFWYLQSQNFLHEFEHMRLLANIERQILQEYKRLQRDEVSIEKRNISQGQKESLKQNIRKENFIRHYLSTYHSPKLPPSWMMIEMLTWGELSHLYTGLAATQDKKQIADNLGMHAEVLESWLKTFNDVRNICAHHGRLWNKEMGRSIKIPNSKKILWLKDTVSLGNTAIRYEKRLYSVLIAIQSLLYQVSPHSTWAKRLKLLLEQNPQVSLQNMGMPNNWYQDSFWLKALLSE